MNNQEEAKNFYVNTLGFEVRTDHTMDGGFRWLTVGPKTQKDMEIVLMEPKAGLMLDDEAAQAVRLLLKKGVLGSGVFEVDDCRKIYEDLKAKGVQFAGAARGAILRYRGDHEGRSGQLVQHDATQAALSRKRLRLRGIAFSFQLSAFRFQLSAFSYQLSAIRFWPKAEIRKLRALCETTCE